MSAWSDLLKSLHFCFAEKHDDGISIVPRAVEPSWHSFTASFRVTRGLMMRHGSNGAESYWDPSPPAFIAIVNAPLCACFSLAITVRLHDKTPAGLGKGTLGSMDICISFSSSNEKLKKFSHPLSFSGPWCFVDVSCGANRIVLGRWGPHNLHVIIQSAYSR